MYIALLCNMYITSFFLKLYTIYFLNMLYAFAPDLHLNQNLNNK